MKKVTGWVTALMLASATVPVAGVVTAAEENSVMTLVNNARVLTVAQEGPTVTYQLLVGQAVQTYYTQNKSVDVVAGQSISFQAKDDRIVRFTTVATVESARQVNEKIMAKDTAARTLDLELTGVVKLAPTYTVLKHLNGQYVQGSLADVFVGAQNVSASINQSGEADLLIIEGKTPVNNMRIGVMTSGFATLEHAQFDVKSAGGMQVLDKKNGQTFTIAADALVTMTAKDGGVQVQLNGAPLYNTTGRLYVQPASDALLQVMTFKRAYGNPSYRGWFEITPSVTPGMLNVTNEVQLENYLYQVVPSEMPASFGLEALKAQSVAARTYALSDYYSSRYAKRGFHVDDSTLSQVYNNSAENALTTQAVNETRGLVMQSNGALVDARYYSTSGGFGAAKHEVWADGNGQFPGTPLSYLTAKSYAYDPANPGQLLQLNTQDEAALNAFYKDLSYTGYDSDSLYFRWKVAFSKAELEKTINSQLGVRWGADPGAILTKQADGTFASKPIPATGAGTISNLVVTKRGAGGNMMELVVEGSTGTYKILKEFNIRFTIRPSKTYTGSVGDVLLQRAKGGSTEYIASNALRNYTILPSSFATFDLARDASGALTGVTFYGGGNGHGVGMSQYGASMLGGKGWTFQQILDAYYAGMQVQDVYVQ